MPADKDVRCFLLEATEKVDQGLRRYADGPCPGMPGQYSYHNACVILPERILVPVKDVLPWIEPPREDTRWPTKCGQCGYVFKPEDKWQVWVDRVYRRPDTGALMTVRDAPPGAMWYAHWMEDCPSWCGPDGRALVVKLPDGRDWQVDSRANNCDSPCKNCGKPYHQHDGTACKSYEDARPHKCWVRKGKPPLVTAGKDGVTCGAGAGSILTPSWHGFLTDGILSTSRNPKR